MSDICFLPTTEQSKRLSDKSVSAAELPDQHPGRHIESYAETVKGYEGLVSIRERRGAGKAITATARKLLKIIYDTLKNGWVFEDFTTFTLAENNLADGQSSQEARHVRSRFEH